MALKDIKDIEVGDIVRSYNVETGNLTSNAVTEVIQKETTLWIDLTLEGNQILTASRSSLFWTEKKNRDEDVPYIRDIYGLQFREANLLAHGDKVLNKDGVWLKLMQRSFESHEGPRYGNSEPIYGIMVANDHNYFADGILVSDGPDGLLEDTMIDIIL